MYLWYAIKGPRKNCLDPRQIQVQVKRNNTGIISDCMTIATCTKVVGGVSNFRRVRHRERETASRVLKMRPLKI